MGSIGISELVIILLVALLVFGAKRLPEIARSLGQGMLEFKKATREISREIQSYDVPSRPEKQPALPQENVKIESEKPAA